MPFRWRSKAQNRAHLISKQVFCHRLSLFVSVVEPASLRLYCTGNTRVPMNDVSAVAKASKTTRSRVTNGSAIFVGAVDGRTADARRFRDVLAEIVSDLGGADHLSEGQRQLARRAAMMSVQCEIMEAAAVSGKDIDLDAFGQLSDRIGRAFNRLGLKRVSRTVDHNPILAHFSRPPEREPA